MSHFFLTEADLVLNGSSDRFAKNIAALRILKDLETSGRLPSHQEQQALAHYSAFGESALLNRLFRFDQASSRFVVHPDYTAFVSADEAKALRRAALTAFYTPLDVIQAIWYAASRLGIGGLERPRIIEPAAGVGHFISAMPADLRARAEIVAVELDSITARILHQIHPDILLHGGVGFETVDLPSNAFDLAISNVPFGDMPVHDPLIKEAFLRRTVHDYFFGKAVRIVRPGGLIIFLTSWGTLDKQSTAVRAWLAEHTDLIGAWRLPHGVFRSMSGSESAADLLILQKKAWPGPSQPCWIELAEVDYPREHNHTSMPPSARYTREIKDEKQLQQTPVYVNRLWVLEPERLVGQPATVVWDNSLWLHIAPPPEGVSATLRARLERMLPESSLPSYTLEDVSTTASLRQSRDLHRRDDHIDLSSVDRLRQSQAAAMAAIYQAAKEVIRRELSDEAGVEACREELNRVYDDFVACYGVISDPRNQRLFRDVPELAFLLALEQHPHKLGHGGWHAEKERIFFERTLRPIRVVQEGTLTPNEALLRCLDEVGELDIQRVAVLCGLPVAQAVEQLGDIIFRIPGTHSYVLADEYLSGNIRAKLREARAWAAMDTAFERNVAALEAVLPLPLGPGDIIVNLNAYWLPGDVVTDFITSILPKFTGRARYNATLGEWLLVDLYDAGALSVEATSKWGTTRANAIAILRASLKGVPVAIYDEIAAGDKMKRVLNPAETVAAQEKQEAIKQRFAAWIWEDAARAEQLATLYNELFNAIRLGTYDGKHLSFPGMATQILRDDDLADYQKGAVWQVLQNQTALLAFAVGAGKTFTSIAAMVEAKRMGLINKALAVVPNNLVGQWASEARRLYPGIRVLAMGPEDVEKQRRGIVLSRIATGDWDVVIVAHTSFKFLPIGLDVLRAFREKETNRLRAYLEELRVRAVDREEKRSLKQIEKAIAKLEARLDGMAAAIKRDSERTIRWEELGIDMLVVDESQEFKNLAAPTKLTNIAGLPSANSQRALDMRIKTWDLIQKRGKVVFLTATPIMNTIGEAYVMQLYLQEEQLEAVGIHHFDEWVSLYAQPRMAFEMKPDGSGFRMNTRLNTFVNVPEMAAMWRQVMNVKTKEQLKLPEPKLVTGKVIPVVVPASLALKRYIQTLAARVEEIRLGRIDPSIDNMLKITGEGRKAALDIRLAIPGAKRPRHSKIVELVKRVKLLYDTFDPLKGTQLIFCDLATPKGRGTRKAETKSAGEPLLDDSDELNQEVETAEETRLANFVYDEIREELIYRGIPAAEIAFIHDCKTKAQRDALFAAMNDGRVRVLLGSTSKMSTGMNVQQRLIALHDLDCPWRPGDLEQRHGRIQRQRNMWPQVYIFTYITEGSFDGYMYQTIESKARFIAQALAGDVTARTIEDASEMVLSAAEVKAIASGNPKIVRKVQLEAEIGRMERVRAVHLDTQVAMRMDRKRTEDTIATLEQRRAALQQACALAETHQTKRFVAQVAAKLDSDQVDTFEKRAEAGKALRQIVEHYNYAAGFQRAAIARTIGHYRGFTLRVKAHPMFAPEIVLLLPDGERIEAINAETESGLFASADSVIRALPGRVTTIGEEIRKKQQRLIDIDSELARMAEWEGQAAYDAAVAELKAINDEFAALEVKAEEGCCHENDAPVAGGSGQENIPASPAGAATAQGAVTANTTAAVMALLAEEAEVGEGESLVSIPPALESLAFMEEELRRHAQAAEIPAQERRDMAELPLFALPGKEVVVTLATEEIAVGSSNAITNAMPHMQISLFEIAQPVHHDQEAVEITPRYPQAIQTGLPGLHTRSVVVFGDLSGLGPAHKRSRKTCKALFDQEQVSLFDHEG